MRPPWMDPDVPGPTARCVTNVAAREAHRWASDVPGKPTSKAVISAYNEARYWCDRCYVADQCLAFALAKEGRTPQWSRDGIYGGKDPEQRSRLAGVSTKAKQVAA